MTPGWHYLRGNKSCALPSRIIFFDCESKSFAGRKAKSERAAWRERHRLWFGCATFLRLKAGQVERREQITFETAAEFWPFVESHCQAKAVVWCIAHNLAFDGGMVDIFGELDRGRLGFRGEAKAAAAGEAWRPSLFVTDDPPSIMDLETAGGRPIRFVDSFNYFQNSLATLGKSFGLEKLPMPSRKASRAAWDRYCRRDVDVLETAMLWLMRFVRENDLGMFRTTGPSQALAAFRHRFHKRQVVLHCDAAAKRLERLSYTGGRVDCFQLGAIAQPLAKLDVNSLYPSIMREERLPVCLIAHEGCPADEARDVLPLAGNAVAEVYIDTIDRAYPKRTPFGLLHVAGNYWTCLAGPELESAIAAGHVKALGSLATYQMGRPFRDYMDFFWTRRLAAKAAGDDAVDHLCKLFMVALPGKFGQTAGGWDWSTMTVDCPPWSEEIRIIAATRQQIRYRRIRDRVQVKAPPQEHPQSFPAVPAFVNAFGRQRMHALRMTAGPENCFYQAVDSLIVNAAGEQRLTDAGEISGGDLGRLRVEERAAGMLIDGINCYTINGRRVAAGVKQSAQPLGGDKWLQLEFERLDSLLKRQPDASVFVARSFKTIRPVYTKGNVWDDSRTFPIILNEPLEAADKFLWHPHEPFLPARTAAWLSFVEVGLLSEHKEAERACILPGDNWRVA